MVRDKLEPDDAKVSRPVLRGERASNDLTYPTRYNQRYEFQTT